MSKVWRPVDMISRRIIYYLESRISIQGDYIERNETTETTYYWWVGKQAHAELCSVTV